MKNVDFRGDSLERIRNFPADVRQDLGYQIHKVQNGEDLITGSLYRVIYIAKIKNTVYVLHAFQKKTQKTSKKDIDLARNRLKVLI